MNNLVELIEMLGDDYLPISNNKTGKRVRKLFKYLKNNESPSEKEAATGVGLEPGSSDFRKVKHHLKLALINGVTAIKSLDKVTCSSRREANHIVWNFIFVTSNENSAVKKKMVNSIENSLFSLTRQFDLQEAMLVGYLYIANHNFLIEDKYLKRLQIINQSKVELDYDYKLQVGHSHSSHSTFLNMTRADENKKAAFLRSTLKELSEISAENRFRTRDTAFKISLRLYFSTKEYDEAIFCIQDYLLNLDSVNKGFKRVVENNLLRAYLYAGRCKEGKNFGMHLLENKFPVLLSQYATQELTMVLSLRTGDYVAAYRIYQDVTKSEVLETFNLYTSETFLILEAYLCLLLEMGLVIDKENSKAKLKIGKFVNSMDISYKEKDRRNIHVIIIRIIYHSLNKEDHYFDHADAIRKYIHRHLSGVEAVRAKNFISALIQWPENGFNKTIALKKSKKYIDTLKNVPIGSDGQEPYGELVPFDRLWLHLTE